MAARDQRTRAVTIAAEWVGVTEDPRVGPVNARSAVPQWTQSAGVWG